MNLSKSLLVFVLILTTSCAYDLDDNLNVKPILETQDAIAADSDLFEHLKDIANTEDRPDESIICIDFIYPLTLFVFDDNSEFISTTAIGDDQQFSSFLDAIDVTYSISMSFPITSVLDSGEEISIDNKEELKDAIDSCLSEELITECNALIRNCVWKIGYSFEDDNTYLGGVFQESNGFTTLNANSNLSSGSWSAFTIENELHININLNDTTDVGTYFNLDWKVEYLDENSLKLKNLERELILNQRCDAAFTDCGNFNFEACETELDTGIAEFILDDYSSCIFDTLEFDEDDENFELSYYETEDDALAMLNPILSQEPYTNTETGQTLYVRINDIENDFQYYVLITLSAANCN